MYLLTGYPHSYKHSYKEDIRVLKIIKSCLTNLASFVEVANATYLSSHLDSYN